MGTRVPSPYSHTDLKSLGAQEAIIDRLHEVAAKAKEILCQAMQREQSLSLVRRRKAAHTVFLLSRRLVRALHAVTGIDRIVMFHGRHDITVCRVIASEFVSDEAAGFNTLPFQ